MTGNRIEFSPMIDGVSMGVEAAVAVPAELTRGNDRLLLERLTPQVRDQDVELDLAAVERIDAAGLSALIALYCDACNSGHRFTVTRPRRHVREILAIVGLDRLLLGEEETAERPAA